MLPRLLAPFLATAAFAQSPPPGFTYQLITDNQIQVGSSMAFAPDGRLFVCERASGRIRVLRDAVLQPTPWATVPVLTTASGEQGLLGIAFDPDFLRNGFVYVFHTQIGGAQNRIARLQEVQGVGINYTVLTPDMAIPATTLHNGGRLVVGQDGHLYAGTGERTVVALAQSLTSWNGKILRFTLPNCAIPTDNPFPGSPIWSYGHRNHFGLTVHPVTGDLFETENGNLLYDELNRIVRGGNYGWPLVEGPESPPNPGFVDPVAVYPTPTPDPTGTCFYTGTNYPAEYRNTLFFVDFMYGRVRRATLDAAGTTVTAQFLFDDLYRNFDIQMGPDGNLWVLHTDASDRGGDEIGRYVFAGESLPSANVIEVSNKSVGGSLTFGFRARNGRIVVPWISTTRLATPLPTPFGEQLVPIDIVLPFLAVQADDRVYRGESLPNVATLIGTPVHVQALAFDPATGTARASNAASITLH